MNEEWRCTSGEHAQNAECGAGVPVGQRQLSSPSRPLEIEEGGRDDAVMSENADGDKREESENAVDICQDMKLHDRIGRSPTRKERVVHNCIHMHLNRWSVMCVMATWLVM